MVMAPIGSWISILGPQLVELFGKDWGCGFVGGGVSLETGLDTLVASFPNAHCVATQQLQPQPPAPSPPISRICIPRIPLEL